MSCDLCKPFTGTALRLKEGQAHGIDKLCQLHRDYAGGGTSLLYSDARLYIAQRNGYGAQRGLVVAINTDAEGWRGTWARTQWPNTQLTCAAWWGHDQNRPEDLRTDGGGWCQVYSAPRGYAVYVPA